MTSRPFRLGGWQTGYLSLLGDANHIVVPSPRAVAAGPRSSCATSHCSLDTERGQAYRIELSG
jgi:hypothetical protein